MLAWLLERRIAATLTAGGLFLLCEEETDAADDAPAEDVDRAAHTPLAGAALVPRTHAPGLWHLLRAGMGAWPLRWGLRSALRALAMLARQQSAAPPAASPADAELLMVAVAPGMQRRGAGSALLRELLSRWDAASPCSGGDVSGGGGTIVLGTHQERSLPFYERAGFAVTVLVAMGNTSSKDGEDASCCWVMQRAGQAAAAPEGRAMHLHEAAAVMGSAEDLAGKLAIYMFTASQ